MLVMAEAALLTALFAVWFWTPAEPAAFCACATGLVEAHQDAIRETTAIYPAFLAMLGPEHELSMQLLTTRVQSEGSLEMWNDAVRDDLAVYNIAVKKQGPLAFFSVATLSDESLAMCRGGNYRDGEVNARKAYEASAKAFGPHAGLTGGTADTLAYCLIGLGKLDEVTKLLANVDVPAVAQLTGDPNIGAGMQLSQAEIAYRKGEYSTAHKLVEEITPALTRKEAEAFQRHRLENLVTELNKAQPATQTATVATPSH